MIEQEFRTLVASKSSLGNESVHLNAVIENQEPPYIEVHKVSSPRGHTHEGRDGTVESRLQVNVFAKDYKSAKEQALLLYSMSEHNSPTIHFITLENEIDQYDDLSKLHCIVLDYLVRHYEQIGD